MRVIRFHLRHLICVSVLALGTYGCAGSASPFGIFGDIASASVAAVQSVTESRSARLIREREAYDRQQWKQETSLAQCGALFSWYSTYLGVHRGFSDREHRAYLEKYIETGIDRAYLDNTIQARLGKPEFLLQLTDLEDVYWLNDRITYCDEIYAERSSKAAG